MRLILAAVGRLKAGPERQLFDRYLDRARLIGRGRGFAPIDALEVDESRERSPDQRRRREAEAITARLSTGTLVMALDERGRNLTSRAFADALRGVLGEGHAALALLVGGPDGLDPAMRARSRLAMAFGAATLPHQLVRVLVAEQVYRAMTLLAGHPYHRD